MYMQEKYEKWHRYINTDNVDNVEVKRQNMSLLAMITLAIIVLAGLLIVNHQEYSTLLNASIFGGLCFVIVSACIFYLTPHQQVGRIVLCSGLLVFNGMLIYSGGTESTALYWLFYYPLMTYSVTGKKWGSFFSFCFVVIAFLLLYTDGAIKAEYAMAERSRFLLSSLVIILFSFINEFYREQSHSKIESVSIDHKRDANTDALTDIPNRRFLEASYFPYLKANANLLLPASLIMTDIDHFKVINDTYGHDVGDKAIVHCVNVIRKALRNTDVLCRVGGEEFLVCIPQMGIKKAEKIAEKIRVSLQDTPMVLEDGKLLTIRSSFGVSEINSSDEFNSAIKLADERLYSAKEKGRNRVVAA